MKIKVIHLSRALLGAGLFLCLHVAIVAGFQASVGSQLPPLAGSSLPLESVVQPAPIPDARQAGVVAQTVAQNASRANSLQEFVKADELYLRGEVAAAEAIYRQLKPPFPNASQDDVKFRAIYDEAALPPAAGVFWRNAKEGAARAVKTQALVSLNLLTERYPEFVPGHLLFAKVLQEENRNQEAIAVLERATNLYPDDPDLLRAKIAALAAGEEYIEASIAARQFSLIYPDYDEAPEFQRLAVEYRDRYRAKLNDNLLGARIGAVLTGALTSQNLSGLISQFEIFDMLGRSEAEVGKSMAASVKQKLNLLDNPEVLKYVQGIGSRLTPYMGRDDLQYEYHIVNDGALNAYAYPGCQIFVNTGAIMSTRSEAELAGLIGHEIAHCALSHGYLRMANQTLARNLPLGDFLTNLVVAQYGQEQERQSDVLGTRVLALSGYAADGLRNLMVTLRQRSGAQTTALTASHPAPAERVQYLESLIRTNKYNRYAYEGVKTHQEMQNRIKGIVPMTPPGSSVTANPGLQGSSGSSAPSQSTSQPSTSPTTRPAGGNPPTIVATQTREQVTIRMERARVRAGTFTADFIIDNQSAQPFSFADTFAQVQDDEGKRLTSRVSFGSAQNVVVQPGQTIKGQIQVFRGVRQNVQQQGMILVINEASAQGRLFRIPF
jgi:predicted Zn-dependent protease